MYDSPSYLFVIALSYLLTSLISPFLLQLMNLLSTPEYESIIGWSECGTMFTIHNPKAFVADVLPQFFKQAKFTSFLRKVSVALELYLYVEISTSGLTYLSFYSFIDGVLQRGLIWKNIPIRNPQPTFIR